MVGIHVETEGPGRTSPGGITPHEEEELRKLAARPDIYDVIARSIAPSIYGSIGEYQVCMCVNESCGVLDAERLRSSRAGFITMITILSCSCISVLFSGMIVSCNMF